MKNMRLTVCIGIMCGWLAAGMLHAGTRPDHVLPGGRRRQPLVAAGDAPGGRRGGGSYYIKEKCHPP